MYIILVIHFDISHSKIMLTICSISILSLLSSAPAPQLARSRTTLGIVDAPESLWHAGASDEVGPGMDDCQTES